MTKKGAGDKMSYKFSGVCSCYEKTEFVDATLVCETFAVENDLEFEYYVVDAIKDCDDFKKLPDGNYRLYFEGEAEYVDSYSHEYGVTEYDLEVAITHVYAERMGAE